MVVEHRLRNARRCESLREGKKHEGAEVSLIGQSVILREDRRHIEVLMLATERKKSRSLSGRKVLYRVAEGSSCESSGALKGLSAVIGAVTQEGNNHARHFEGPNPAMQRTVTSGASLACSCR